MTRGPRGKYPDGDKFDIMNSPLNDICWSLGTMKEQKAVPALISVLERRPRTPGAALRLGEIGDQRAIPILMRVLKDRSGPTTVKWKRSRSSNAPMLSRL